MDAAQASAALDAFTLKPGQRAAAQTILTTRNRVIGVQGLAGTGKSFMVEKVKAIADQNGFNIVGLASYGTQVKELRALGIEAQTVASFVGTKKPEKLPITENTILVVDEAGVIATKNMDKLLQLVERFGCRVVLIGDTEQTKAIEAGRPFAQLQAAGMETPLMGDIVRQQDPVLRHAVELAAAGKATESIATLDKHIRQYKEPASRYQAIANDYAALSPEEREKTLIITGTNASRKAINQEVRTQLGLSGQGRHAVLLDSKDMTQAQRRHARYYAVGNYIRPERAYRNGLQADVLYQIVNIRGKLIEVSNVSYPDQPTIMFNPSSANRLSVFAAHESEISTGEKIRITRPDTELKIANGQEFTVSAVQDSSISLSNENRTIEINTDKPIHMELAYTRTVHSAQGQTKDRVLINLETKSRTTKTDVYYVGISREKNHATIYTDNKQKLPAAVSRRQIKGAALDIDKSLPHQRQQTIQKARHLEAERT